MRGMKTIVLSCLVFVLATGVALAEEESPIASFGALVIGEWETADSRHTFEWGVGKRVVRSRSYFRKDGTWELVSEGWWFWDGAQATLRGFAVAVGMPVEVFEYRSIIEGAEIVHDLEAQGAAGGSYVERWRFAGDEYDWSLESPDGGEKIMAGTYRRAG